MTNIIKYHSDVCTLKDCPPKDAKPIVREAYRYVKDKIGEDSFLPASRVSPRRRFNNDHAKCFANAALSMYISRECAIEQYRYFTEHYENFAITAGTHLAMGKLLETHGVASQPRPDGHFGFFEYQGCDLVSCFDIIEKL